MQEFLRYLDPDLKEAGELLKMDYGALTEPAGKFEGEMKDKKPHSRLAKVPYRQVNGRRILKSK